MEVSTLRVDQSESQDSGGCTDSVVERVGEPGEPRGILTDEAGSEPLDAGSGVVAGKRLLGRHVGRKEDRGEEEEPGSDRHVAGMETGWLARKKGIPPCFPLTVPSSLSSTH